MSNFIEKVDQSKFMEKLLTPIDWFNRQNQVVQTIVGVSFALAYIFGLACLYDLTKNVWVLIILCSTFALGHVFRVVVNFLVPTVRFLSRLCKR